MDPKIESSVRFKSKVVMVLLCKYCKKMVCSRGMRAILLADSNINLFSTDHPSSEAVCPMGSHYTTSRCFCMVVDVGCKTCGNCVGYTVAIPCSKCLQASHNGHLWMFHSNEVDSAARLNYSGTEVLRWGDLIESDWEKQFVNRDDDQVYGLR